LNPNSLSAFRYESLLILFWNQDAPPPRDFRLVLNKTLEVPKPYLGLPLGETRERALYIALTDPSILSGKVSVKLIDPDNMKLATLRKARLLEFREQDLADLSPLDRQRISKGLTKGLRQTFPTLEMSVIDDLLRLVTWKEVASPAPLALPALPVPTVVKPSSALAVKDGAEAPALQPRPQPALMPLKRAVRCLGKQPDRTFILDIEHCGNLPGLGLFFSGYQVAAPGRLCRLVLHLPSGRLDLTHRLIRTARPALVHQCRWVGVPVEDSPGLECFVLTDQPLALLERGYLAAELDDATVVRVALRPVINLTASRDVLDEQQAFRLLEGFGPLLGQRSRRALQPLLAVIGDELRHTQNGLEIKHGRTVADSVYLQFDQLLALSDQNLHLSGWLADVQQHLVEIRLFTAFGDTVDLTGQIPNAARPDVGQFLRQKGLMAVNEFIGFQLRVDMPLPLGADTPIYLRVRLRNGARHRLALKLRRGDVDQPLPLIRELLGSFPTWEPQLFDFYNRAVGPTIAQLWAGRVPPTLAVRQETFGVMPSQPQVSVIVPLYGRVDLLSFQLAQFADDPDFQHCELIYVLDDPRLLNEFVALCRREYPLFRVPFRTVISGANLGYAGATNLGAAQAQGEYLLLLNSDVFPRESGWLSRLVGIFEGLERPGVLGPKLLFPDGLIQHAGMTFFQEPTLPGFWFNDHPDKGLPNDAADVRTREAVAVTGACMLLKRAVYQEVRGLSEDYILGDFEDSDLCLKLQAAGYRISYTPQVELYHLERLSFPHAGDAGWRTNLSRYNAWVQTKRWGEMIEGIQTGVAT